MAQELRHQCYKCLEDLVFEVKIGRRDTCPNCGANLHSCRNCRFWNPSVHNQCTEVKAEFIRDREDGNFCGFFQFRVVGEDASAEANSAKSKLEALFGAGPKKPTWDVPGATSSQDAEASSRAKLEALFKK